MQLLDTVKSHIVLLRLVDTYSPGVRRARKAVLPLQYTPNNSPLMHNPYSGKESGYTGTNPAQNWTAVTEVPLTPFVPFIPLVPFVPFVPGVPEIPGNPCNPWLPGDPLLIWTG